MVCAEFAPWAKTGGLADAVAGLSDALSARGHDVRVLLPRYEHLPAPRGTRHIVAGVGGLLAWLTDTLASALVGLVVGSAVAGIVHLIPRKAGAAAH